MQYIDTHSHIYFKDFEQDRNEVLGRMEKENVYTISVGTSIEASKKAVEGVLWHKQIVGASIGIHPTTQEKFAEEEFEKMLTHSKTVAVGECGLDYYRMDLSDKPRQKALFENQIQFAIKHNLPLMLHIRSSSGSADAHDDAYEMLSHYKKQFPSLHLHMHFFTASYEVAAKFLELDASFGIPGVVTFARSVADVVKELPIDKILAETDSPYAAPIPHRGKRNEPAFVKHVVEKIAKIKGLEEQEAAKIIFENSLRVFELIW